MNKNQRKYLSLLSKYYRDVSVHKSDRYQILEVPYEGAKEMILVDDVENKVFLRELLEAMYKELPEPKKKGGLKMNAMERVCQFLDEAQTYYLATMDGDQPRVRPFGTTLLYNGRLYIQTGKVKNVSKQIAANPKVEICACKVGEWLRLAGELVNDDDRDVKVAMLEKMPSLKGMYSPDDDNMQMLYFKNAEATFSSFTAEPETISF